MRLPWSSKGLCVFLKADRREPKENALQIQTCVTKGVALADRKFAIVCHLYGRMFQGWRGGLQNRLGGFDSQPSLPESGQRPDNVRPLSSWLTWK